VLTGEGGREESEPAAPSGPLFDRPVCVYVTDGPASGHDKVEEVVLKNEKIALALKAFRTVKMTSADADADPLLAGKGREVPRMLLVEPADGKVTVIEKGRLSTGGFFTGLQTVSGRYWAERLDRVVKEHLSMLTKQDQLANEEKVLTDKVQREEGDTPKARKLKEELDALRKAREEIAAKQVELWKLTPRGASKTS
jgi:uncharacterized membrane protein YccC